MIIPKEIKVGGHIYPIVFEDRERESGKVALGTTNVYSGMKIWIDTKQDITQQESTLIHEFIEIINSLNGLDLSEHIIRVLETSLYQILKDNDLLK